MTQIQQIDIPALDGVFGPEIYVNTRSGQCCALADGKLVLGQLPGSPATNGFLVRIGSAVVAIVSEGVEVETTGLATRQLREMFSVPDLPVAFTRIAGNEKPCIQLMNPTASSENAEIIAKAAAYVAVQCAWTEGKELCIELADHVYRFRLEFVEKADGGHHPVLS